MDQAVLAGVGNLLADETLWRARLSPLRPAGDLDAGRARPAAPRAACGGALGGAAGRRAHGPAHPPPPPGGRCPRCRAELRRATVGGRTTWWCPAEQAETGSPRDRGPRLRRHVDAAPALPGRSAVPRGSVPGAARPRGLGAVRGTGRKETGWRREQRTTGRRAPAPTRHRRFRPSPSRRISPRA